MTLDLIIVKYTNNAQMMSELGYKLVGKVHSPLSKYYDYAFEYKDGIFEDLRGIREHGNTYLQQRLAEIRQSESKTYHNDNGMWDF